MKEKAAYDTLFSYSHPDLFSKSCFASIVNLKQKFVANMSSLGIEKNQATKKHVQRKLEADFSINLDIISDYGKLVVRPDNLSKAILYSP